MFTVTEPILNTIRFFGFIMLGGGLFMLNDTRGRGGKGMAFLGVILMMFATAIEYDYPAITWLAHKPTQNEDLKKWQEAVERGKYLQEQIDRERQQKTNSTQAKTR